MLYVETLALVHALPRGSLLPFPAPPMRRFAVFLLVSTVLVPSFASVSRLSLLASLGAQASSAPDAQAYSALRRIWAEWDKGDPAEVEEELAAVARARRGSTRV